MLLRKHKRILLSRLSNPKGKLKLTLKIPPPKQMITKWFFQRDFCEANLVKLSAAAASFSFPGISHGAQSQVFTFYALNTDFLQKFLIGHKQTQPQDTYHIPQLNYQYILSTKTQKDLMYFHTTMTHKEHMEINI